MKLKIALITASFRIFVILFFLAGVALTLGGIVGICYSVLIIISALGTTGGVIAGALMLLISILFTIYGTKTIKASLGQTSSKIGK